MSEKPYKEFYIETLDALVQATKDAAVEKGKLAESFSTVVTLEKQLIQKRAELKMVLDDLTKAEDREAALCREISRLRKWTTSVGHLPSCAARVRNPCTCGLDEALAQEEKP